MAHQPVRCRSETPCLLLERARVRLPPADYDFVDLLCPRSVAAILLIAIVTLSGGRPADAPPMYTVGNLPFIGTFLEFAKNPVALVAQGYEKHGPCYSMSIFGQKMTFLLGPIAHDRFFSEDDRFLSQSEVYKFMTPVFGKGIVYDAPPKMMSSQMAFIKGALKGDALHRYVPIIVKETEDYFNKHWKDGEIVDLHESMAELIILTASSCLMGPEVRETLFDKVASIFKRLDDGITPLSFFWPTAPIPAHWDRDAARADMGKIFAELVQKRRSDPTSSTKYHDVLQVFVDSKYKDGSSTTEEQVCGLMVALLFAGQHTSSITTTWLTLLLSRNPASFAAVRKEVDAAWDSLAAEGGSELDFARVDALDELNRCFLETLRLYPPLVMLMRKVMGKPLKVGKYNVPVGDIVVASPQVSHRLPEGPDQVFTKPDTFDPDRFKEGREEHKGRPSGLGETGKSVKNFIGFGGGHHSCRGEQFARVQAKAVLSVMLRDWEIEPVGPMPKPNFAAIVVGPDVGTPIRVRRRARK